MAKGQFIRDWFEKLPFEVLGYQHKIDVVSNDYRSFKEKKEYGLVIIDEAHLFLRAENKMHINLTKYIEAEKVVFLTATPIKTCEMNLGVYVNIAEAILRKKNQLDRTWLEKISAKGKGRQDVICSQFDRSSPVTRYFKDTINALTEKGLNEKPPRRAVPHLWEYEIGADTVNNKMQKVFDEIREISKTTVKGINEEGCEVELPNRFIIFTRLVKYALVKYAKGNESAENIVKFLSKEGSGFKDFDNNPKNNDCLTYKVITGDNSAELSCFDGKENLPDILILSYKIAEQGVNLPGFNYVINFHISAYPSALEQRFGRIDRMNSEYTTINVCYPILKNEFGRDTNTLNFYNAAWTYAKSLITYLPARNVLISEKIVNWLISTRAIVMNHVENISELCENPKELQIVMDYFYKYQIPEERNDDNVPSELAAFCLCNNIDEAADLDDLANKIFEECIILINDYKKGNLSKDSEKMLGIIESVVRKVEDHIFYSKGYTFETAEDLNYFNPVDLETMTPVECAGHIKNSDNYKAYSEEFTDKIEPLLIFGKKAKAINDHYAELFLKGDFDNIFTNEDVNKPNISLIKNFFEKDEWKRIEKNAQGMVYNLGFFKMCRKFAEYLFDSFWYHTPQIPLERLLRPDEFSSTTDGPLLEPRQLNIFNFEHGYAKHPFATVLCRLHNEFNGIPDSIKKQLATDNYSIGYPYFMKFFTIENGNKSIWLNFALICSNRKSTETMLKWQWSGKWKGKEMERRRWSLQNVLFFNNEYRDKLVEKEKWGYNKFPIDVIHCKKYRRKWINDNRLEQLCESEETWS